jgi:polysaccharide export outer membrane protein
VALRILFIRILLLGLVCLAALAETTNSLGVSDEYRCGPGDRLSVTVFEVGELTSLATIDGEGMIRLPLVEAVAVGNLTTREIEDRLVALYVADLVRDPNITAAIEKFGSQPVSVLGAVQQAGVFQLQGSRRLLEVLAMAGGLSDEAGDCILIRRPGPDDVAPPIEIAVPIKQMLEAGTASQYNPWIVAHDTIQVERAGLIYVLGSVNRPGGFPIKDQEQITALQAIALAEGSSPTAFLQKAQIIRSQRGIKLQIPIPVKDVIKGKIPDPVRQPNDIPYVPDSRAKAALSKGSEAIVQMAVGLVIWR